jgi:ElaB/YqjD/DUF883 family membrane-anchored ribosome-binding protein
MEMKSKVTDIGRSASDMIEESRSTAASGLDSAAEKLRESADKLPGGDRTGQYAHAAAQRLGKAADYLRTHDVQRMVRDAETFVKDNPGPSLLIAAAFGFLIGRAITRD